MHQIPRLIGCLLWTVLSAALAETPVLPLELRGQHSLSFTPAEVVCDAQRGFLWISDPAGKRLLKVALDDAWTTEEFPFDLGPEAMSLSPDGRWLYVALVHVSHGSLGGPVPSLGAPGALVEMDLVTGKQTRLVLPMDPLALAATDRRRVVVSGEQAGQFSTSTADLATGTISPPIIDSPIAPIARLQMHPGQRRVYAVTQRFADGVVERGELSAEGDVVGGFQVVHEGVSARFDSTLAIHPDGTRLLTRQSGLFALSDDPVADFTPLPSAHFGYLGRPAFDPARKSLFGSTYFTINGALTPVVLRHNEHGDGQPVSVHPAPLCEWLFPLAESLFAVGLEENSARLWRYNNPAAGAENNHPPSAHLTVVSAPLKVGEPITLDAGASTDDEPGLQFSWSVDVDGAFSQSSTNATFQVTFTTHGTHYVFLRVQDRHGEAASHRERLDVSTTPDVVNGPDFRFTVMMAYASDAVFDPVQPTVYVTEKFGRRILRLNLDTGFLEGEFDVPGIPTAVDISPDGTRLYVTSHPDLVPSEAEFMGMLTELDPATGALTGQVRFAGEASDVVATGSRTAVVAADLSVLSVDFKTGPPGVSGLHLANVASLAATPDRTVLVAGDTGGYISRIARNPETGELNLQSRTAGVSGDPYLHRPFLRPDGQYFVLGDGRLFDTSFAAVTDIQPLRTLDPGGIQDAVFDLPARRTVFFSTGLGIRQFNAATLEPVRTLPQNGVPFRLGLRGSWIYSLFDSGGAITVRRQANPALGDGGNQAPVAHFTVTPTPATTRIAVRLDARTTTDDRDSLAGLQFRWVAGDGNAQTEFSPDQVFLHRYPVPGQYTVRLEVRDTLGETNAVERTLEVVPEADPGELVNQPVGDTYLGPATDVLLDPVRPYAWLTDQATGDLLRWNFETGQIERRWNLAGRAMKLAFTPDASRLYAVVDPDTLGRVGPVNGLVAEFDPDAGILLRHLPLELSPLDLVATDSGYLVVSSASDQNGEIHVYRRDTGARTSTMTDPRPQIRFALNPNQRILYAADTNPFAEDIVRYDLDPVTGLLANKISARAIDANIPLQMGGVAFLLPGEYGLISSAGYRFALSPIPTKDLRFIGFLPETYPSGVAAVPARDGVALLNRQVSRGLEFYSNPDLVPVGSRPLRNSGWGRSLTVRSNVIYVATDQFTGVSVERFVFPARTTDENAAPVVAIVDPARDGAALFNQPLQIRVEATDDDGSVTNLVLWADGEKLVELSGPNINEGFSFPEKRAYTLRAVAQDNFGASSTSAPVVIRLTDPPSVTLVRPDPGQVILAPATVEFEVAANDPDGSVRRVEFYLGEVFLGAATSPPYTARVENLTTYSELLVVVEDDLGIRVNQPFYYNFQGLPGDESERPFSLEGAPASARASNREATRQTGDPTRFGEFSLAGKTVWWQWSAPTNCIVTLSTEGSSFDTALGVYVVTNRTQRLLIASNDDGPFTAPASFVKFRATNDGDYRILVDGARRGLAGDIVLTLDFAPIDGGPVALNDAFANRILIEGTNVLVRTSNVGASRENAEPQIIAGTPGGRSLWWEWRPPEAGLVTISTDGSGIDTLLGVYRGGNFLSSLQSVVASDDDPRGGTHSFVRFVPRPNDRLLIAVDGFSGVAGDIRFQLEFEAQTAGTRPPNDDFEDRIVIPNAPSLVLGSSLGARADSREPQSASVPVWWTWTAPVTQPVVVSTVGSSFNTVVSVYLGDEVTQLFTVARGNRGLSGGVDAVLGEAAFLAVGGRTYQIAVGSDGFERTGAIVLSVRPGDALEPAPLASNGLNEQGLLQLHLVAETARDVVILSSTNLLHWLPIRTNRFEPGAVFSLETGLQDREFFRGVFRD